MLLQFLIITWFFANRDTNIYLETSVIIYITMSTCIISYLLSIPFYILFERPIKNFLELVIFPTSNFFEKKKDVAQSEVLGTTDSEDSDDTETDDSGDVSMKIENLETKEKAEEIETRDTEIKTTT